jgi:hypothetical protein
VRFWFTPADPVGLHAVRLLGGLLLLAWLLPFAGQLDSLFGTQGWFDQQAYTEAARFPDATPKPITWSVLYLCGSDARLLALAYWLSIGVLVLFTLGFASRLTAVLTWVVVASFTAHPAIDYDGDVLLLILSFYLMVGYLLFGQRSRGLSPAERLLGGRASWLLGRATVRPSLGANLALRLLQVHLALVLVTSGLHKLQFGAWWAGIALWFPLYPPFETTLAQAQEYTPYRESYLFVLSAAAYLVLAWQIGFPLFAWRRRWRPVLLGGAALGWLGTALVYRMPVVGPAVFIGCVSFVSPAGWHRLLARIPGLRGLAPTSPPTPEEWAEPGRKKEAAVSLVKAGQP